MRVLVLGCGEMGIVAIRDLVAHGVFSEVAVAARHREHVEAMLDEFPPSYTIRLTAHQIDAQEGPALAALMRGFDVVCNLAGPNFRNAVPIARAAIAAQVPLVDVSDDWAATLDLLALDGAARKAGIPIVVGMGASPGVTNIMARYGASKLDRVDEVHTSWVMRGSDLGGPACCTHLLYSLPDRAFVYADGAVREVRPFVDGREALEFPCLGKTEVVYIGHPEPFTLSRYLPGVQYADDKATFLPECTNDLLVRLFEIARSGVPTCVDGEVVDSLDSAAGYLYRWSKRRTDVPQTGALRTEVVGELGGKRTHFVYSAAGRITIGTGVPAAIGAQMIAAGKIREPGVYPPEACVDAEWFFMAVSARHLADLREESFVE